ncbi:ATP-binding protein [Flavobacterium sp. UGB4466]|uniref:ATP-binding protein n=1 Tax=Flavobacterium sp. UGB4466 TaxID=2730889 RepID=UPI00192BD996|nr:ATP-binding protein [Flavobacterium sp. UGB4466]
MKGVPILLNNKAFTPFHFYSSFLGSVASFYRQFPQEKITFFLIGEDEKESFFHTYYFDPISIPLFLSLADQLSKFHKESITLQLYNTHSTKKVLAFLDRSDFFKISGDFHKFHKNILSFNKDFLGFFDSNKQRPEHKVRFYSLNEGVITNSISTLPPEQQRDYLIEYYTYKVKDHFEVILNESSNNKEIVFDYVQILSELITNGVLHSKSDVYALMFTDKERTCFSISDNGIGLFESLKSKQIQTVNTNYKLFDLYNELFDTIPLNVDKKIKESFYSIFEALYYSILKDRKGLFDLMTTVVLNSDGYFRLHNHNAQIIISLRMMRELYVLVKLRGQIYDCHQKYISKVIDRNEFEETFSKLTLHVRDEFKKLITNIISNYNSDVKYSSIRLFEVRFKGVHIEVEIPKKY